MRRLSTPRAAGLAGVLFAVLFGVADRLSGTAINNQAEFAFRNISYMCR